MPKYLHLEIPTPCHEDWNKMNPEAQGRFCGSCQKTVTDFTNMSDAQLIAFFTNSKPSVCGRFNQEQLQRDILIPRKRIAWVKYFFQFILPAFLLSLKSSAQTLGIKTPIEKFTSSTKGELLPVIGDTSTPKPTTISGTVKDTEGNPVPYTSVVIKGTMKGVASDSIGNFSIDNVLLPCTITVSCIGYTSTEMHLPYNQKLDNIHINIQPELQQVTLGIIVTVRSRTKRKIKNEIKKETFTKPVEPTLLLYPNPFLPSTPLHLKWQNLEAGNYRIEIYSTSGVLMKFQKMFLEKGLQETSITINELLAGNYFVRLINEKTGKQLSEQFIVQE